MRWTILAALLVLPSVLEAQSGAAAITGFVTDTTGIAVPSVEVAVVGSALRTVTDSTGRFAFPSVVPGERTLTARRLGFATRSFVVTLRAAETAQLILELAPLVVDIDRSGHALRRGFPPARRGRVTPLAVTPRVARE